MDVPSRLRYDESLYPRLRPWIRHFVFVQGIPTGFVLLQAYGWGSEVFLHVCLEEYSGKFHCGLGGHDADEPHDPGFH